MSLRKTVGSSTFIALATACALLVGAGDVAAQQKKRFEGVTVRLATYGGAWRDLVMANAGKAFEAEGGTLEIFAGQPANNMAKLIAARGRELPFDIMETTDNFLPDLTRGGFLQEINLDKVPNRAQLEPHEFDKMKLKTWTEQSAILYNTEKFKELGIAAPTKYSDLLDPKLAGRISIPDIAGGGSIPVIVGLSIEAGGDEANIDPGLALISKMDIAAFWSSSSQLQNLFKTGDIWVGVAGVHNIARLRGAVHLSAAHVSVKPGSRGMLKDGWMVLLKGAKNPEAVEFVINEFIGVANQTAISKGGLIPSNKLVRAEMAKQPDLPTYMILEPEGIKAMYAINYDKVDQNAYVQKWNRQVAKNKR